MLLVRNEDYVPVRGAAAALGMFDGVHLGHRLLLERAKRCAAEKGLLFCVYTFSNHPAGVLIPGSAPKLLTTDMEKAELMKNFGVDVLFMPKFTAQLAALPPERFARMLKERMGIHLAVVGFNYRFARDGSGDPGLLEALGRNLGFDVAVEPAFSLDGQSVSSTRIRTLLERGEVEKAAELCGRPYCLTGRVQDGNRIGRRLDAPTANISVPEEKLIPSRGVYVAEIYDGSARYAAVVNIGVRPTLCDGRGLTVEAHALNCAEDFYQKTLTISFLHRLRDERKFDSLALLQQQIARDAREAGEYLKNNNRAYEKPGV